MGRSPFLFFLFFVFSLSAIAGLRIVEPTTHADFDRLNEYETRLGRRALPRDRWLAKRNDHTIRVLRDNNRIFGLAVSQDFDTHIKIYDFWIDRSVADEYAEPLLESIRSKKDIPHVIAFRPRQHEHLFLLRKNTMTEKQYQQHLAKLKNDLTIRDFANDVIPLGLVYDEHTTAIHSLTQEQTLAKAKIKVIEGAHKHPLINKIPLDPNDTSKEIAGIFIQEETARELRILALKVLNSDPTLISRILMDAFVEARQKGLKLTTVINKGEEAKFLQRQGVKGSAFLWEVDGLRLTNAPGGHNALFKRNIGHQGKHIGSYELTVKDEDLVLTASIPEPQRHKTTALLALDVAYLNSTDSGGHPYIPYHLHPEYHINLRNKGIVPKQHLDHIKLTHGQSYNQARNATDLTLAGKTLYETLGGNGSSPGTSPIDFRKWARTQRKAVKKARNTLIAHYIKGQKVDQATLLKNRSTLEHLPTTPSPTKEDIVQAYKWELASIKRALSILNDPWAREAYDNEFWDHRTDLSNYQFNCLERYRMIYRRRQ